VNGSSSRRDSNGASAYPDLVRAEDEPFRILRVIARLNVGGPALHVSYLSSGLADLGYETQLVAGSVGEGEGSMEWFADSLGVRPVIVPELQREISPLADPAAVMRLRELIRDFEPDILHTHTAKAGAVGRIAASLPSRQRPRVLVHTFHGHVLRGYFNSPTTAMFRILERELARRTDALIAVSPQVRDDLVRLGVAPAGRIAIVRLGLDLEQRVRAPSDARASVRRELDLDDGRFVVGWFGRMTEIKRVDHLLAAFARARDQGLDAALALVGDGPLRERFEQLAGDLGIADECRFVGYREDVARVYAAVDAVALTSANEGTPVSVIEAQAAGLPVVSTDVGGLRDVVVDGETGFLVASGDVAAFAERRQELAADPTLRRELGEAGRIRVMPRYSVPRLVDDMDRLYRTLLQVADPHPRLVCTALSTPLTPAISTRPTGRAERPLRVILMSQYFAPEVGATQTRMQSFAEHLSWRGHEVTVITELPNHPIGVIPERYRGHLFVDDRSNPYRVLRVWVRASHEKTPSTRMAFYLSYMALATAIAPFAGRADVVMATSPPLFTGVAGLAIARLKRAPFVLDVRDLWPAAAVSLNQIGDGFQLQAAEAIEKFLYRQATRVVAVTRPFCDHIDAITGGPPAAHIPNGTVERFFAGSTNGSRSNGEYVVTFAGTHGIAQALPSVLDAAEQSEGVRYQLVGEGPMKEALMDDASVRRIANVEFYDQLDPDAIVPVLAASDALLVSLAAHPTFEDFVPSKMIDFMAVGRPVVLAAAGESARILERSGGGIAVPPEDPRALANAVRWLAGHPAEGDAMGRRGRDFARSRLRSVQAERLEALLIDVTRERG
jgi:glycosyltransferase involved in cell wall biosynthesis